MSAVLIKPDSEVGFALTTLLRMCARAGTAFFGIRAWCDNYLPAAVRFCCANVVSVSPDLRLTRGRKDVHCHRRFRAEVLQQKCSASRAY